MLPVDKENSYPIVNIDGLGAVRGVKDGTAPVVRFLNIPFATINKRWNPATSVKPWDGIRDATKIGFSPPQPTQMPPLIAMLGGVHERIYDETCNEKDCLNLNIYAPHESVLASNESLPVMVWVYGGAFRAGGNSIPMYDATNLVAASVERKTPIIVVVLNYRVNFFGFMASKELKEDIDNDPTLTGEQKAVGNWGLQDQKLAFLWVRDHIGAFNGNNKDITAFGESAGSVSIAYHMMIPAHHGLFHKAILQSGGLLTLPTKDIEHQCQVTFDKFCKHVGIVKELSNKEKIARLRAVPEKTIVEFVQTDYETMFSPTIDSVLIDRSVHTWLNDASRLDPGVRRVLIGSNEDEGTFFGHFTKPTAESWRALRAHYSGANGMDVFDALYGRPDTEDKHALAQANARVTNDVMFQVPMLSFASLLIKAPHVKTSMYHFSSHVAQLEKEFPGLGASHAVDLLFVFDSPPCRKLLNEDETSLAREVRNVWLEMVTTDSTNIVPIVHRLWEQEDSGDDGRSVEENVIVFRRDYKVGRSKVNWISKETFGFWMRFFDYQEKLLHQGSQHNNGKQTDVATE